MDEQFPPWNYKVLEKCKDSADVEAGLAPYRRDRAEKDKEKVLEWSQMDPGILLPQWGRARMT